MARFLQLGPGRIVNLDLICVVEPDTGEGKNIRTAKKVRLMMLTPRESHRFGMSEISLTAEETNNFVRWLATNTELARN